jgi:histone deacetylase 6
MVVTVEKLTNVDVIRAYQTKKAQERWGLTPLPISKKDVAIFQDQVFCSKDFYNKKTLVLFIHDAPDVVIGTNATVSSTMDLNEAFLVSSLKTKF